MIRIIATTMSGAVYRFDVSRPDEPVPFDRFEGERASLNAVTQQPIGDLTEYTPRMPVIQTGRAMNIGRFGFQPPITTTPVVGVIVTTSELSA